MIHEASAEVKVGVDRLFDAIHADHSHQNDVREEGRPLATRLLLHDLEVHDQDQSRAQCLCLDHLPAHLSLEEPVMHQKVILRLPTSKKNIDQNHLALLLDHLQLDRLACKLIHIPQYYTMYTTKPSV